MKTLPFSRRVLRFRAFRVAKKFMLEMHRAPTGPEMASMLQVHVRTAQTLMHDIDGADGLPYRFSLGRNTWRLAQDVDFNSPSVDEFNRSIRLGPNHRDIMPVDAFFRVNAGAA